MQRSQRMRRWRRFAASPPSSMAKRLEGLMDRLALRRADFHRYSEQHQGFIFADAAIKNRHGVRVGADGFAREFMAKHDWATLRHAAALLEEGGKQDQATAERLAAALACLERAAAR